ncbi:hypothetical protein Cgig2_003038 [Carnegiea gigantea]|uniref:DUF4283 domain-containing protein n=1 Tax=Carnegiea gigantea TaxID=171969 RepID=A0A9Q1K539_9CARY|nr:hypothetical protein Cgig2_003038 [Carnegiea gigantea]
MQIRVVIDDLTPGIDPRKEYRRAHYCNKEIYSSYASVVDPDEGTKLKFVPTRITNGVKCAKLEKKDVYWGLESLSKIGSILEIPIKTYRYAKEKSMICYAKLLIDISSDGHFPKFIEFFNDNDELVRQQVKYEWKPTKCTHCHMFGYEEENCKRREGRKERRKLQKDPPLEGCNRNTTNQQAK